MKSLKTVGLGLALSISTRAYLRSQLNSLRNANDPNYGSSAQTCQNSPELPSNAAVTIEILEKGKKAAEVKIDAGIFASDFKHPDNLDECKLKQLDDRLRSFWSRNETTVITVDFSEVGTFDDSDNNDFVLRAAVFWQKLAGRYASSPSKPRSPNLVSFGLLTPSKTTDAYRWRGIQVMLAAAIKDVAQKHTVWAIAAGGTSINTMDSSVFSPNQLPATGDADRLKRGVNIGKYENKADGTDLQWRDQIPGWFDHVRVMIKVKKDFIFNSANGSLELGADKLNKLDLMLASVWRQNKATIITIDLSELSDDNFFKGGLDSDNKVVENLPQFWQSLAYYYVSKQPSQPIFFEVFNEPQVKDPYRWWGIQEKLVEAIKNGAPHNTVIATGASGSNIDGLVSLVPLTSPNVIYSFHYYNPYEFTLQGADWIGDSYRHLSNLKYPSDASDAADKAKKLPAFEARDHLYIVRYGLLRYDHQLIEGEIEYLAEWAKSHRMHVICDEFGVKKKSSPKTGDEFEVNGADPKSRVRWIEDVRKSLENEKVGWTVWDYNSASYGITDSTGGTDLNEDVMQALGRR